MYTLDEIEHMTSTQRLNCLIPMDHAVAYLEPIWLTDEEVLCLRQGRIVINKSTANEKGEYVRLYDKHKHFIGLGEKCTNGDLKAQRLLSFKSGPLDN